MKKLIGLGILISFMIGGFVLAVTANFPGSIHTFTDVNSNSPLAGHAADHNALHAEVTALETWGTGLFSSICPAGQYAYRINSDGTLSCRVDTGGAETDPIWTAVSGNYFLTSNFNSTFNARLNASTTIAFGGCTNNQILKWNGSAWVCATDQTGGTGAYQLNQWLDTTNTPTFVGLNATSSNIGTLNVYGNINSSGLITGALVSNTNMIYVAKWGNDSNNGRSINSPKLTIAGAIAIAASSDTIYVYPGIYNETDLHLPFGSNLIGVSASSTQIIGTSVSCGNICLKGNNEISNISIIDPTTDMSGNCINIESSNISGSSYIFKNIYCKAPLDNIYTLPFSGETQNINMKIYDSYFESRYDGLTFLATASSTFEVYNTQIVLNGDTTSYQTSAIAICNPDHHAGDRIPTLFLKDSSIIAKRTDIGGDVSGIGIGKNNNCYQDGGAKVTLDNVFIDVTSPSTKTGYGIYVAQYATSSQVEIFNSHINTHGVGKNYDIGALNGTWNLGGVNDYQTSTGTVSIINSPINIGQIISNTTATSTFSSGINMATGCFAINGTCISNGGSGSGTVSSGLQNQLAFYNTDGTTVSGTSTVSISPSGLFNIKSSLVPSLLVGTTSPLLNINGFTGIAEFNSDGGDALIYSISHTNSNGQPGISGLASRGSASVPIHVNKNDFLLVLGGGGYGATDYVNNLGRIVIKATQDWTDSNQGTSITFETNPNSSGFARVERMIIDNNGNVGIATTTPGTYLGLATQPKLTVDGNTYITGNATSTNLAVTSLSAVSCDVKSYTNGLLYCGTDATGAGGTNDWKVLWSGTTGQVVTPTSTNNTTGLFVNSPTSTITTLRVADSLNATSTVIDTLFVNTNSREKMLNSTTTNIDTLKVYTGSTFTGLSTMPDLRLANGLNASSTVNVNNLKVYGSATSTHSFYAGSNIYINTTTPWGLSTALAVTGNSIFGGNNTSTGKFVIGANPTNDFGSKLWVNGDLYANGGVTSSATISANGVYVNTDYISDFTGSNLSVTNGVLNASAAAGGANDWKVLWSGATGQAVTPTSTNNVSGLFIGAASSTIEVLRTPVLNATSTVIDNLFVNTDARIKMLNSTTTNVDLLKVYTNATVPMFNSTSTNIGAATIYTSLNASSTSNFANLNVYTLATLSDLRLTNGLNASSTVNFLNFRAYNSGTTTSLYASHRLDINTTTPQAGSIFNVGGAAMIGGNATTTRLDVSSSGHGLRIIPGNPTTSLEFY
jgi:hypothetical protein